MSIVGDPQVCDNPGFMFDLRIGAQAFLRACKLHSPGLSIRLILVFFLIDGIGRFQSHEYESSLNTRVWHKFLWSSVDSESRCTCFALVLVVHHHYFSRTFVSLPSVLMFFILSMSSCWFGCFSIAVETCWWGPITLALRAGRVGWRLRIRASAASVGMVR